MRTRSLAEYPKPRTETEARTTPPPPTTLSPSSSIGEADTPAEHADRTDDSAVLYAVLARMDADSSQRGRWTPFSARRRNTSRRSVRSASVFAARDLRRATALRWALETLRLIHSLPAVDWRSRGSRVSIGSTRSRGFCEDRGLCVDRRSPECRARWPRRICRLALLAPFRLGVVFFGVAW